MKLSAVLSALHLATCRGLSVPPEAPRLATSRFDSGQPIRPEEGRRLGQTGAAQRQRIEAYGGGEAMTAVASHEEMRTEGRIEGVADALRRENGWANREAAEIMKEQRNMAAWETKSAMDARSQRIEAERQKQKDRDQAKYAERAQQRAEEKRIAQEEWEVAQKFRAAQHAVDEKQRAEKVWQSNILHHEEEMASQLWKQAEDVRAKAEQGDLRKDAMDYLFGSSSEKVAEELVSGLVLAASNARFTALVNNLRLKSNPALLVESIKHKTDAFVIASEGVNDNQFVPMLARFLNESQQDLRRHEESEVAMGNNLMASAPDQLKRHLALILSRVIVNSTLISVDTHHLSRSNSSEACSTLAQKVTDSYLQMSNLAQMKEVLDTTSKIIPKMASRFPKTTSKVAPMAEALLSMAYVEHLALKEASSTFISKVAPVIVNRLHCTFSDALPHAGMSLFAVVLSMMAMWLSV